MTGHSAIQPSCIVTVKLRPPSYPHYQFPKSGNTAHDQLSHPSHSYVSSEVIALLCGWTTSRINVYDDAKGGEGKIKKKVHYSSPQLSTPTTYQKKNYQRQRHSTRLIQSVIAWLTHLTGVKEREDWGLTRATWAHKISCCSWTSCWCKLSRVHLTSTKQVPVKKRKKTFGIICWTSRVVPTQAILILHIKMSLRNNRIVLLI